MIQLNNLSFFYDKNKVILEHSNFTFEAGMRYALRGVNGIGKTTLIKLLLGLLAPNSGSIDYPANVTISYLPDSNGIYEYLTVLQNIQFRLGIYNIPFVQSKDEVGNLLKLFDILDYQNDIVSKLSTGTKKKVAIICSLVVNANILILDEPTMGLDFASKQKLMDLLLEGQPLDSMVICITHDEDWLANENFKAITIQDKEVKPCSFS
ncbi:ABC transporter ATP-binding protein [Bengtsoniella intestinalis]|uniref:ATP-binding cassette domain-containing protein n=1 Tax=Bengtsoniella intestinalis TaxID=3073143 RepID=UPI00391FA41C